MLFGYKYKHLKRSSLKGIYIAPDDLDTRASRLSHLDIYTASVMELAQ